MVLLYLPSIYPSVYLSTRARRQVANTVEPRVSRSMTGLGSIRGSGTHTHTHTNAVSEQACLMNLEHLFSTAYHQLKSASLLPIAWPVLETCILKLCVKHAIRHLLEPRGDPFQAFANRSLDISGRHTMCILRSAHKRQRI